MEYCNGCCERKSAGACLEEARSEAEKQSINETRDTVQRAYIIVSGGYGTPGKAWRQLIDTQSTLVYGSGVRGGGAGDYSDMATRG